MSCFQLSPQGRLTHWRDFRHGIVDQPRDTQLKATAAYWAQAPLDPKVFDLDGPWPNTWTMLETNNFCRHSLAICIESTLRLVGWSNKRLVLRLINDSTPLLVLVADETLTLNYAWGAVHSGIITRPVLRQWQFDERDYHVI